MEFQIVEQIEPNLNYYEGESPISKLEAEGWELVQLIPEYDLVECNPPRKLAQPTTSKPLNITGMLQVSNYIGLFRK